MTGSYATVFDAVIIGLAIAAAASVLLAGFFDMVRLRRPMRPLRTRRPSVTVIVQVKGLPDMLAECLNSLATNRYRRFDVVVMIQAGGELKDRRRTREIIHRFPNLAVRRYEMRRITGVKTSLRRAYHRSRKGEIIAFIDQSFLPDRDFLKKLSIEFGSPRHADEVWLMSRLMRPDTPASLAVTLLRFVSLVFRRGMARRSFIATDSAFRAERLRGTHKTQHLIRRRHVSGLRLASGEALRTSDHRSLYALAAGMVLVSGWLMYEAATLQNGLPFTAVWVMVTVWLALALWMGEQVDFKTKLLLTTALPIAYMLFVAAAVAYSVLGATKAVKTAYRSRLSSA